MKWAYSLRQKTKIAFWSSVILILIFAKNWVDKTNVTTLYNSFASVYEDRLVVESYIFQLSEQLYQKKIVISNCSSPEEVTAAQKKVSTYNATINQILVDYEKTKLTTDESMYFESLKDKLQNLITMEENFLTSLTTQDHEASITTAALIQKNFDVAMLDLNQLSKIQLIEGKSLKDQSKEIAAGSTLWTQLELVVIIGIALLIQILIFASRSDLVKKPQQFELN